MNQISRTKLIIANRLREARTLAGLSQGRVAKILDLHRPSISEIEAGNRSVSAEELTRFAEIYDVSIVWLSGLGAETQDPLDDRMQLAFRELCKLKPADIDRLMKVLASVRAENEQGTVPWTEELNARRCGLIDMKLQGGLNDDEASELDRLQQSMRRYINQEAPLPFDAAKRLHADLLKRKNLKHSP